MCAFDPRVYFWPGAYSEGDVGAICMRVIFRADKLYLRGKKAFFYEGRAEVGSCALQTLERIRLPRDDGRLT